MRDHFALLDEARRPWIDPDLLKQKFLALAAEVHPDRVHQAPEAERITANHRYSDLNAAYHCLRSPKERLRHLLELELGAKPADIQRVPAEMMDAHFAVAKLCQDVDLFLAQSAGISSPILKVQLFARAQEWTNKIRDKQNEINARRDTLVSELQTMNPLWEAAAANRPSRIGLLERLDVIYRLLGYLNRWSEQLQERFVQLSLQ